MAASPLLLDPLDPTQAQLRLRAEALLQWHTKAIPLGHGAGHRDEQEPITPSPTQTSGISCPP